MIKFLKKYKILLSIFFILLLAVIVTLSVEGWTTKGFDYFVRTVFLDNFLAINAVLLGTLTLIGYLILGRTLTQSIVGALKTIIGVLLLSIGAGILVGLAKPIFSGIKSISDSSIVPLDPYLGWASSNKFLISGIAQGASYVSWVSFALIVGFIINIILVALKKWTNVHSLMITGHIMFQQTAIVTACIYLFLFSGFTNVITGATVSTANQIGVVLMSGILVGSYWGVASTSTIKGTNAVTNNAGFAVGHQQMWGASIAYKIGKYFGNAKDSAETRKLSKKFKIFEDNIFTQSLIITILFLILIIILRYAGSGWDPSTMKAYSSWKVAGNASWVHNAILGSLKLVASIIALTTGVRMFVTELQQSFQGISEKVIPGTVVAVDCAATYGFAANSVTYGFLSGVFAQFISVGILIWISQATDGKVPMLIPLFITLFFNSGTIGVFANASGGIKAAIIVPLIFGFVEIFTAAGAIEIIDKAYDSARAGGHVLNSTLTNGKNYSLVASGYIGMADWNLFWAIPFMIGGNGTEIGWITFVLFEFFMLFIAQYVDAGVQKKKTFIQKVLKAKVNLIEQKKPTSKEAKVALTK